MNETITLQFFNDLEFSFKTYLTILNEKIRKKDKFLSFDDLLKNLKYKEFKMTQNDKMINYVKNKNTQKTNENSENENVDESKSKVEDSKDNSCYWCDEFDHIANDYKHKKSKCHNCDEIDHLRNNCRNEKKKLKKMTNTIILQRIKIELYILWKRLISALSELALSIALYDNYLRSIERWNHIFSWCSMSVAFKTPYRSCFDDVLLMKSNCFNRNASKKRVSTAKQRKWIMKIIRFYAAQFATEVKCHLNRKSE